MMKKIFSLVLILVLGKISHSQSYPLQQNLGSDSTIVISKGALQSRIIPIVVSDTNAANAQRMKNYPGAQLYTTSGDFYIRNYNTTKWVLVSSGSSGSVNIYTADGTLTGNRTLTGAGNNLTFDGLNKFTVNTADSVLFNTNTFDIKGVGGVLNVEGTAAGTSSSLTLKTASDGNWTISTGQVNFNSGDLRFYDNNNGANRIIIKPSGNVGIGTDTPDSLLTVNGGVYIGGGIRAPGLPTASGTKALRIDANGNLSVADTTAGGGGLGTVTSVATNDGSGITGGTITSTGTLAIDTAIISTRLWRQKGIDSVAALINNNVSGISGYVSKFSGTNTIDTSQLFQNGENLGLGTTTPNGRLAIVDTGGFALKINYNSASNVSDSNAAIYAENNGLSSYVAIFNEKTTNNTGAQLPLLIESSLTTGTPQANMGTGMDFGTRDDANNRKLNRFIIRGTDPAAATYTSRAEFRLWNNGVQTTPYYWLGNGNMGLGTSTPDSNLTVVNGALFGRGIRASGLPQAPGTKALRIDASGTISYADTLIDAGGTVTSVATNDGTGITGGTITTSGTLAIDTTVISTRAWRQKGIDSVASLPRVTSVGLTMPSAFNVSGSPVTSAGTLSVTGAGLVSQYIRGDGTLADFPGGGGGGGASVSYYLNGSVNQGTFVGNTYYQMSKTPIFGTGTNFTINADGYIAQFITDSGNPGLLKIPGGNWNFETFFSASSGGGTPTYYVELYKYDGTTFTLIASGSTNPDVITGGTSVEAYFSTLPVPETVLTLTDRLAVRIYVTHAGRTITLHTEDNNLCQVITTFTTGITALNGLTEQVQYFTTGTSGTDFNISSSVATHTFNLPTASATNRGALSTTDWSTFNNKIGPSDTTSMLSPYLRKADTTAMLANYINNVGYALSKVGQVVSVDSSTLSNYYLRRKDSLTATNLLGYVTRTILADTAAAIRGADSGGTVTSVATNNGTGITGGTITTSGTLAIDTTVISTRAWRQKGIDSVAALINSNVSGTTNYVSKFTGTNTLGNSQIFDNGTTVGIANALPSQKFEVGDGTQTGQQFARFNFSATNLYLGQSSGTAFGQSAGSASLILSDQNNPLAIGTNQNQPMIFGTNNSERMRVASTGNVGIGTSSPDSMLTVTQGAYFQRGVRMSGLPAAVGTKALRIDASGTVSIADTLANGISGSGTTNYIPKFTSSSAIGNSVIYESSSNIGIGTTAPESYYSGADNLVVAQGSGEGGITIATANNTTGALYFADGTIGTEPYRGGIAYTHSADVLTLVSGGAEKVRITSGGNVGIGTSSPDNATNYATLSVNGSGGGQITLQTSGTKKGYLYNTSSNVFLGTEGSTNLIFETSASERMRITSGGNVGIGSTTPTAISNYVALTINATSGSFTEYQQGGSYAFRVGSDNSEGGFISQTTANPIRIFTNSNERMRITSGGEVYIAGTTDQGAYNLQVNGTGVWGAGAYVDGSDSALKRNIQPLGNSLEIIKQMRPVTFEYQPFYSKDTATQTGFIAQELQQLLAGKVYKNGVVKEGGAYLGVAYQSIIPLLVQAVKELEAEVQSLKSQLKQ